MPRSSRNGQRAQRARDQPLYQQLVGALNARILQGTLEAGAQLPSERNLSEQFGVSRSTVRQALDQMSQAGLLTKIQGRGTFISSRSPITQPLDRVTAFREALVAQGMTPGLRLVDRTLEACDFVLSRVLAVPPNAVLTRLVCLGLGNGEPLVIYRSHVSIAKLQETVDVFCNAITAGSTPPLISELYAHRRGLKELRTEQTFESRLASAEEAALLSLDAPAAVFDVTSLVSGPAGDPVEYRRAVYRGDRYKFNMERSLHL